MQVKGTVVSVYSVTKSTRAGDKTIWYGEVDDGNTVNLGFKAIWEEGEYVTVNVEEKYGELQIARGGPKAAPRPAGGSKPAAAAPARKGGGRSGGFPIDATDSQVSIIRQSSLNRAVDTVRDMINAGVLEPINQEEYNQAVFELAYSYTDFATGQREVKAAKHKEVQKAALEAVNG